MKGNTNLVFWKKCTFVNLKIESYGTINNYKKQGKHSKL